MICSRTRGQCPVEETLALGDAQPLDRARQHEHADAATDLDITVVLEALIGLGHGQRIGAMLGGKRATDGS